MSYNLMELDQVGANISGVGSTAINHVINPGPNTRVYLYCDVRHTDSVEHEIRIGYDTDVTMAVTTSRAATGVDERLALSRPIVVEPGGRIAINADAMGTAASLQSNSVYVELPQGQTLDPVY